MRSQLNHITKDEAITVSEIRTLHSGVNDHEEDECESAESGRYSGAEDRDNRLGSDRYGGG